MKISAPNSLKAGITIVALLMLQASVFFDISAKFQQIACRTTQAFQFLDNRNSATKMLRQRTRNHCLAQDPSNIQL